MSVRADARNFFWLRKAASRLRRFWVVKMVGTLLFMAAFFTGYFLVLNFPRFAVTPMPVTAIDRLIGFQPGALLLYVSLWFYVPFVPALLVDKKEIRTYCFSAGALAAAGLAIFFFWPTAVPPPDIDWARYPTFGFLKEVDATGNACPSLHVAFAVFSAIWFGRVLRQMDNSVAGRIVNGCWCVGIVYSTLATKQHVVVDVVAGALLGFAGAMLPENFPAWNSTAPDRPEKKTGA